MPQTIYVRTPEGQAAAYDQSSAMPRKLRSLLKVVDGKTTQLVYANSLKSFSDVAGLLKSLHKAGMIGISEQAAPQFGKFCGLTCTPFAWDGGQFRCAVASAGHWL